jgi:hypothetical protein
MSDWKYNVECCGNCAFWPLGGFQHDWKGAEPLGIGGPGTDGTVSECRRRAPVALDRSRYPGSDRLFPSTRRDDYCGDFEARG